MEQPKPLKSSYEAALDRLKEKGGISESQESLEIEDGGEAPIENSNNYHLGQTINVVRTSGATEGDWFFGGTDERGNAVVKKQDSTGILAKRVPFDTLNEWNTKKSEVLDEEVSSSHESVIKGKPVEVSMEKNEQMSEQSLEQIGKERLERVNDRVIMFGLNVNTFIDSAVNKAYEYSGKKAKGLMESVGIGKDEVVGVGRKLVHYAFAAPELKKVAAEKASHISSAVSGKIEAGEAYVGRKYADVIEGAKGKYNKIADKISDTKDHYLGRVRSIKERYIKWRQDIAEAKAEIQRKKFEVQRAKERLRSLRHTPMGFSFA